VQEVALRDGLQSEAGFVPTEEKIKLVDRLAASGLGKIEVSSFVSPRAVPQLADAEAVFQGITRRPGVIYAALVPNVRGMERAIVARADEVNLVMSASESHNRANLRMSGDASFQAINPGLIMLRISGYGQTGPYRDLPSFGAIGEAMGGLRHLTGQPGQIPVRCGISIGDTLAALHGTIGVLMALHHRKVNGGAGQVIDVALHESVFNAMESMLPEYSARGVVRAPAGSALPGIAPSNAYRCLDGVVLIAGNGDAIFTRLMTVIGRDDLGRRPDLASNQGRVKAATELDQAIGDWTERHTVTDALAQMGAASVPAGRIYDIADIAEDPHYRARDMILKQSTRQGFDVEVPGIVPKLLSTPGAIHSPAPVLGEHTRGILDGLGFTEEQQAQLKAEGVIA
jgi:formyl-CoA transferase